MKHNITQEDYKNLYPDSKIFADGLLDIQKEYREKVIAEKYTPEEIYNFRCEGANRYKNLPLEEKVKVNELNSQKSRKTFLEKYNMTLSDLTKININAHYDNLRKDIKEYESYNKRVLEKRTKTNMEKYGVKFAQQLESTKEKQKQTLIKRFGSLKNAYDNIASKSVKTRMEKYGKIHFCPMFSIKSQELFVELDKKLESKYTLYYATKGNNESTNEYQVLIENGTVNLRFLDFYVKELNKCIEFNEKYHYYDKQMESDKIRTDEILSSLPEIKMHYVNEKDWETNKELVISQCLEFLLNSN